MKRCMSTANNSGKRSNGKTCLHIIITESIKTNSVWVAMSEKKSGAVKATNILHKRLYPTSKDKFPPNIAATTGADVAVGQKRQMNAPCATIGSNKPTTK